MIIYDHIKVITLTSLLFSNFSFIGTNLICFINNKNRALSMIDTVIADTPQERPVDLNQETVYKL